MTPMGLSHRSFWEQSLRSVRTPGIYAVHELTVDPTPVLGTVEAATDLLEKRGDIYSSRPPNILV